MKAYVEGQLRDFPGRAYLALLFRSDTQDWWGTILNLLLVTLGSIEFGSKQPVDINPTST